MQGILERAAHQTLVLPIEAQERHRTARTLHARAIGRIAASKSTA